MVYHEPNDPPEPRWTPSCAVSFDSREFRFNRRFDGRVNREKLTMPVGRTDVGEKMTRVTRGLLSSLDELRSWVSAYALRLPIVNYTMEDYRN